MSTGQDLSDERSEAELFEEAEELAAQCDYVIFIGGLNKSHQQDSEGSDRLALDLPYNQDALIRRLAAINPNLVVVNISGNAVAMPWINEVPAIVQGWFLGSEAGNALANVLTGKVNPSGKLPFSFPVKLSDNAAHALGAYPGENGNVEYKEGLLVGYRWHDAKNIKPLFPFGHGLSYTHFSYSKLRMSAKEMKKGESLTCTITLTNNGDRDGSEVVQLYLSDKKSALPRPPKELKGFQKVELKAGESREVSFVINEDLLQYYNDREQAWAAEPGRFEVLVGASSQEIKAKAVFNLK